jgi:hypothetical protein
MRCFARANIYVTKTANRSTIPARDRPEPDERGYFLARSFGFAFGVKGAGGEFNIVRKRSSVRRTASSRGSKSSDLSSAACCVDDGLRLVMG